MRYITPEKHQEEADASANLPLELGKVASGNCPEMWPGQATNESAPSRQSSQKLHSGQGGRRALIGAAARDAAAGAAVGGAVTVLVGDNQIQIPPNTLPEFHLQRPLQIP